MSARIVITVIAVIFLTACGFQLRGSGNGPGTTISSIYINDRGAYELGETVRSQLALSGTEITEDNTSSEYTLELYNQNYDQSVLSVSALTGKVEEYQLSLTVRMTVRGSDNKTLLANQLIRVTRDYAFDDRAVLGSESERELLENEMSRQAASQIIRRLFSITR